VAGNYKMNKDSFIEKSIKIHKYEYDYSDVNYKNTSTKVIIKCKIHGPFEQTPNCHLIGRGCPKCYGNIKYTNETFIEKCVKIWGDSVNDKYDFSKIDYKNNKIPIKIICKKHGEFYQRPDEFLHKHGCDICGGTSKSCTKEFVKKSKIIHNEDYDYSKVSYKDSHTKIEIGCKKHGFFKQQPNGHLNGNGCPICKLSKGEIRIKNFLNDNSINYFHQKTFDNCKYKLDLVFDFYLPEYKTCIEYDGIQHNESVEYFGGEKSLELNRIKDNIKNEYCKNNNMNLLRISYNKFKNIEEILKMTFLV